MAVAERDGGEVRVLGTIPNREQSVGRLVGKLGPAGSWKACHEAGPTGYVLYRQLAKLGVPCVVVASTLVPVKAGDRVMTDRRDAERLARGLKGGGSHAGCGCLMSHMRRCGIWCEHGRRRKRISFAHDIGWGSSCCATGAVHRRR